MNDQAPVPLDDQRALTAAAFDALIEQTLRQGGPVPGAEAQWLLNRLVTAGLADTGRGESGTLTLCGITAASNGAPLALLRNWQSAVRQRLAAGLRR